MKFFLALSACVSASACAPERDASDRQAQQDLTTTQVWEGTALQSDHGLWFDATNGSLKVTEQLCSSTGKIPHEGSVIGATFHARFEAKRVGKASSFGPPDECSLDVVRLFAWTPLANK